MTKPKKDLKATVEQGIMDVLESDAEPSDGRIKALALGIKMCALNAKLEESAYGDFFNPNEEKIDGELGNTGSVSEGPKPKRRRRANGEDTLTLPE